MIKKIILLVFVLALAVSCKKDYTCKCTNSSGSYDAGVIEAKSKHAAKDKCNDLSSGSTTCGL